MEKKLPDFLFRGDLPGRLLMRTLEYVCTYIDDLLVVTMGMYDNYLDKAKAVLDFLQIETLHVNVKKSSFTLHEIEYLGYVLLRDGIKPQPEKVSAILSLNESQNVKEVRRFLGIVQYYRDI